MRNRFLCAVALVMASSTSYAALFSGASSFTTVPFTTLGGLTNNLILTDNANGFVVSGQVIINVPPGPVAGSLVFWIVDRPLDPSFGTGNLITTTVLDGFSLPPAGTIGNSSGIVESKFTNFPVTSLSQIPVTLPAGAATWNNIIINSSTFAYVSGGVNFLRQRFDVDGVQLAGPGGNWIVDVPVSTSATVVPEPTSAALLVVGFGLAVFSRRHSR